MAASISINNVKAILLLSHWFTLVFSLALLTTYSYGHATWSYLFLCSVAGIIGFLMTLAAWRKRSIGLLALVGSVMTMIYLQAQNFLATGTCAALVLQGVFLQAFLFFFLLTLFRRFIRSYCNLEMCQKNTEPDDATN